ncbi:MAG: hypothetical protein K2J38_06915 [Muribaculaceae bacterium]|nr:hypothetical protein [Muribaculaceae bacterium]
MRRFSLLLILLAGCAIMAAASDDVARTYLQALYSLDDDLNKREGYIKARQARIDSLTGLTHSQGSTPELLMDIAKGYMSFNNDSAIVYLMRGIESSSGIDRQRFRWNLASLLPLAGFFNEAISTFDSISPDSIPRSDLISYYDAGRQMHSYMAAFFGTYPGVHDSHMRKALEYQSKMIEILPTGTSSHKFNLGEYYFLTGRRDMARVLLEEVVASEPPESNLTARAANHLAVIAHESGNNDLQLYYLALSAIADTKSATREVMSLQELGTAVYDTGDITRAYKYLGLALENAVECGAPLRMIDTSKSLPIIQNSHSAAAASWRRTMYWILAAMFILVMGLIASMMALRHEMRRMKELQLKLEAANTAKEVYISRFLQLCSIYMDKLNNFCKIAVRKIAAGQSDEFYRMLKSGKFIEEQTSDFYEVFDNAFLHIYPDFVEQVNTLLRPECRIEPRPGEMLNTDLRILAFMRLGIEESARIAQVLNYSLNTIYAYRNRLKARAIDKDNFESQIAKLN